MLFFILLSLVLLSWIFNIRWRKTTTVVAREIETKGKSQLRVEEYEARIILGKVYEDSFS